MSLGRWPLARTTPAATPAPSCRRAPAMASSLRRIGEQSQPTGGDGPRADFKPGAVGRATSLSPGGDGSSTGLLPRSAANLASSCNNTLLRELSKDRSGRPQSEAREVWGAHYVRATPAKVPDPKVVITSQALADILRLDVKDPEFAAVFSGNLVPQGFAPWATVYGCHHYGMWAGQLGDGRAMSLGEVPFAEAAVRSSATPNVRPPYGFVCGWDGLEETDMGNALEKPVRPVASTTTGKVSQKSPASLELQLKGAGVTPFSRGFDGKAVMRSTIREFLASEHMAALGVPTTRCLSVCATGEVITRPWYQTDSDGSRDGTRRADGPISAFPPNRLVRESGAVGCRIAPSFLRFAQLELFHKRGEDVMLLALAEHVLHREFPWLHQRMAEIDEAERNNKLGRMTQRAAVFKDMLGEVARRQGVLVAEWLRVGYVQGNMNSDNTLLGGRTLDYGPFGFVDAFVPTWTPFTSDYERKFGFLRQPSAAALNVKVLAASIAGLIFAEFRIYEVGHEEVGYGSEEETAEELVEYASRVFTISFSSQYTSNCRRKLGLGQAAPPESELKQLDTLWNELLELLAASSCDYTMFFWKLSDAATSVCDSLVAGNASGEAEVDELILTKMAETLSGCSYTGEGPGDDAQPDRWLGWLRKYRAALVESAASEASRIDDESMTLVESQRKQLRLNIEDMRTVNPRYILRSFMAQQVIEHVEAGNYEPLRRLHELLSDPYTEQSSSSSCQAFQNDSEIDGQSTPSGDPLGRRKSNDTETDRDSLTDLGAMYRSWQGLTPAAFRDQPGVAFYS
mmetsp:Transcript_9622/g.35256  ORF Transcript_9622/g.35256 Transcript_9622/m.35256 type:complete len:798 (+) Transcript_9622:78-2471(+)